MHPQSFRAGLAGLALFALAPVASQAGPVTLNLQGHVTGYEFIDLSDDLPVDTAVSVSLTFNETFSDGSYSFADNLGPVSGSMTVGNAGYSFDGFWPITYHLAPDGSSLEWVTPVFTGTGPDLGTGDFFGLWASFTPALTLAGELALGFRFESGFMAYALVTADSYSITPASTVPTPATLALAVTALLAAGGSRRRA